MATKPQTFNIDLAKVFGKRGFKAELGRVQKADAALRERDAARGRILGTDTLRDKDIGAAKLLMTTLGGVARPITLQDLRTFVANAAALGDRFKGGITAKELIETSRQADRDRSNEEIRTAVVSRAAAGTLYFVTNAGPDSKALRHFVNVEFPAFKDFATGTKDPAKLAKSMLEGPLRYECDCEHFKYFLRYVATKGRFCAGRLETGFPRFTNPVLAGAGCKHGLRVMQAVLRDPHVRARATAMIAAGQKNDTTEQVTTAAEAKVQAQRQKVTSHHVASRVETAAQAASRRTSTSRGRQRALEATAKTAARNAAKQRAAGLEDFKQLDRRFAEIPMTAEQRAAYTAFRASMGVR